jgi:hypothetical protein
MYKTSPILVGILYLTCLSACQNENAYVEQGNIAETIVDENDVLLAQRPNKKYDITALFYGTNTVYKDSSIKPLQNFQFIVFKENKSGNRVLYHIDERDTQAFGFYFIDIWSPDNEHVVLPRGKKDGFVILESKTLLKDLAAKTYTDSIRIWQGEARKYWHNFGKWQDNQTISFSGEGEKKDEAFIFTYDFRTAQLTCAWPDCVSGQSGENKNGRVKPKEVLR